MCKIDDWDAVERVVHNLKSSSSSIGVLELANLAKKAELLCSDERDNQKIISLTEVYACVDSKDKFLTDFVGAWTKVMNLDRF